MSEEGVGSVESEASSLSVTSNNEVEEDTATPSNSKVETT